MHHWQMMAADRLTQLQDAVNQQAENFCNSIGMLQHASGGSPFPEYERCSTGDSTPTSGNGNFGNSGNSPVKSSTPNATPTKDSKSSSPQINIPQMLTSFAGIFKKKSDSNDDDDSSDSNFDEQCSLSNEPLQEDVGQTFARLICRTAKDIDTLIDSLPPTENESSTSEIYINAIKDLQLENAESAEELAESIRLGEEMLETIQEALSEIADLQLKTQMVD